MNRYKKLLALLTIAIVIVSIFAGCTNLQRKPIPSPSKDNKVGDNNQSMTPGGSSGGNTISATFEMVDFSYATVASGSVNVRAGASTAYPSIGKVYYGQKIRVVGKIDGWYVVKMPTTNRIGCVAKQYLRAYTTTNTTSTPKPIPQTTGTTGAGTATGSATMSADEGRILQLCNAARAKNGAGPLKSNGTLTKLARMKSQDMVNKNYFSHQSPTYGSPFDMMKTYGVTYMYAGENIAINQTADATFNAWMNSEGHRKNILNPNFTEIGIGIAPEGNGSNVYTQEFIGN